MSELEPRNSTELFGHSEAYKQLEESFSAGKLPHGLLITGPKGIGKATLAYHFARQLLAPDFHTPLSDDDPISHRIAANSHADMLVIEPEYDSKKGEMRREISVEQARKIAEFLSLTPGEGTWRVVIIDSVDALNVNAANAILKILEEPPAQTILMLISHNPGGLLPTIRSRCQQLKLTPLSYEDFANIVRDSNPEILTDEMKSLEILSGGSPGLATFLQEKEALETYSNLLTLLENPLQLDTLAIHGFAQEMGTGKQQENWQVFTHLVLFLMERVSKTASGLSLQEIAEGEGEVLSKLAALYPAGIWAIKWQQCADQFSLAQSRYLDYKQVIITFIHSISEKEGFLLGNAAA